MFKDIINKVMSARKDSLINDKKDIECNIENHINFINWEINKMNERLKMLTEIKGEIKLIDAYFSTEDLASRRIKLE